MIKTLLFTAVFFLIAYLAGSWGDIILYRLKGSGSFVFRLAFGGISVLFATMTVCELCAVFHASATVCAALAAIIAVAGSLSGIMVKKRTAGDAGSGKEKMKIDPVCLLAVLAVAILIYEVTVFRYEGTEAIRPLAAATAVFDTGRVFAADPMMLLIGTVSAVTGIHPLRFVFGLGAAIFITLYFLCYYALISTVLDGRKRTAAFFAVVLLNIWGYQSAALVPATLLISWFLLPVYLIHGLCNIAAVILISHAGSRPESIETENEEDDDLPEEWDMKKHKIVNARNLAIAFGVLAAALVATVFVLNSKINRLYDATVNLQNDMNSRCSIYEFITDDGNISGYLIKGSDGNVSLVGGGGAENSVMLGEFIAKYTDTIDNWYVYGDNEEESGAMKELTGSGKVDVQKVYVINREEIKGLE